jgi:hypothetical protein
MRQLSSCHTFFFFLTCLHKKGMNIRISDIRFIRRDSSLLIYLLKTSCHTSYNLVKARDLSLTNLTQIVDSTWDKYSAYHLLRHSF